MWRQVSSFLLFERRPVRSRNGTRTNHLLQSEPDLKRDVQHLGVSSPKTWSPKTAHFRVVVRPNRDSSGARLSPESNALQTNGKQLNKPRRV